MRLQLHVNLWYYTYTGFCSISISFRPKTDFRENDSKILLYSLKNWYTSVYIVHNDGKIGLFILIMAYFISKRQFGYEICRNETFSTAHIRLKMNSFLGLLRPILKKVISGTVSRSKVAWFYWPSEDNIWLAIKVTFWLALLKPFERKAIAKKWEIKKPEGHDGFCPLLRIYRPRTSMKKKDELQNLPEKVRRFKWVRDPISDQWIHVERIGEEARAA